MTFFHASELGRNEKEVLLFDRLEAALVRQNPGLPMDVIREAIRKIRHFETNDLFTNNKVFHKYMTETVEVAEFAMGKRFAIAFGSSIGKCLKIMIFLS
jgi:type I restriction enzyme, R subunit